MSPKRKTTNRPFRRLRRRRAILYKRLMKEKWNEIVENLGKALDSGIFKVWVTPLRAEVDADCLRVFAPNAYMAEWLKRRLSAEFRKAASPVMGKAENEIALDFRVGEAPSRPVSGENLARVALARAAEQVDLPIPAAPEAEIHWRHNFDDFVTGASNRLAAAAARDLCESGQVRTLFINSAPGLGKTHLTQAAGQAIARTANPLKVGYLTAERFASRFVTAMRAHELEDFKSYLCGLDALFLEDVHFLSRKKAMQEMILAVVKNLQEKGSRVVFTSSFAPRDLREIDERLVSHFCSGILAGMDRPDMEMRREILRRKAGAFQVDLPDEICDALSRSLSSDVRQLESCLKNMVFKARLLNSGLTLDLAMETVGQYAGAENVPDIENIVRLVCESFGLTRTQLCSRSRKQDYVQGRNTVFYLARKHTDMSLEEIGGVFNRKHSAVLRSITKVERELARESRSGMQIARAVALIERKCGLGEARVS